MRGPLFAFFFCIIDAAEISTIGQHVKAGKAVDITVVNASEVGSNFPGKKTTHLKIGIVNTIYDYWMCSLTSFIPARDGKVTVTVPPDIGPTGLYYGFSYYGFQSPSNGTVGHPIIGPDDAKLFYLSGGKGDWTPAETVEDLRVNGLVGYLDADIPCSSYDCARSCAAEQFPSKEAWRKGSAWLDCLEDCDDVAIDYTGMYRPGKLGSTSTIRIPSSLPKPTAGCKEDDYRTPCGQLCCGREEYCSHYEECVALPSDAVVGKSKSASMAMNAAPGSIVVAWAVLVAIVGALMVVGVPI